jgi:hypothetical protein
VKLIVLEKQGYQISWGCWRTYSGEGWTQINNILM